MVLERRELHKKISGHLEIIQISHYELESEEGIEGKNRSQRSTRELWGMTDLFIVLIMVYT